MTDTTTPNHHAALLARIEETHADYRHQVNETARLMHGETALDVQRYLHADGNGITWRELLTEIGGIHQLAAYLTPAGKPDPDRIRPVIDRIFERTAVTEYRGGMTVRHSMVNRD